MVIAMAAVVQASHGQYESASWLIVWCALLDRVDGFTARLLNACSDFGIQFDTLADFLAFCITPATLVYLLLTDDPRYAPTFEAYPARAVLLASVGAYVLLGALRLARFNVQAQSIGPKWSRGLPVTIAGSLVSTFILAAWELSLPPEVVAASPIVLVVCAVFMISTLWLPKSLDTENHMLLALQVLGATAIYGLGATRTLPTVLLAAALAYPSVGFVFASLHPPTISQGSRRFEEAAGVPAGLLQHFADREPLLPGDPRDL